MKAKPMRVLSMGAGVQSTALALMCERGELPKPDCAIFADTGWEPAVVMAHLDWLEKQLSFPLYRVQAANIKTDALKVAMDQIGALRMPFWVLGANGKALPVGRQCTLFYKIEPVKAHIRSLLDKGMRDRIKPGAVEMWLGITRDEASRMKPSPVAWLTHAWPLIDAYMSRHDCLVWLEKHGYPTPPKSSCIGCPFHSDGRWRIIRDQYPDEWADAIAFDKSIRDSGGDVLRSKLYLHKSLTPLDEVDLRTMVERGEAGLLANEPDFIQLECEGMCGT